MSVIVEGFYKPKNCFYCPFNKSNCFCVLTDGGYINRDDGSCSATCPIKELPKGYGRLIDADEFHHTLEDMPIKDTDKWFNWLQKACNRLAEAPTIIEADKGSGDKE